MAATERKDILPSILLWAGRIIAGTWAVIFLISINGEAVGGYPPGGSVGTAVFVFASGGIGLVVAAICFWRPFAGGLLLLGEWLISVLSLFIGVLPEANVAMGLETNALTQLLPGVLLIAACLMQRRHQTVPA